MVPTQKRPVILAMALFAISTLAVAVDAGPPLVNWSAPATYTPGGKHIMAGELGGGPSPFFPITPCRQFDSRNTSALTSGVDRTIQVSGGTCGIPAGTLAVSMNITIFNISGAAGNGTLKLGTAAAPTTSWINYPPTETQRANAGAVPLSGTGAIVVQAAQGGGTLDLIVDVNGYYLSTFGTMPTGAYFGILGNLSGGGIGFFVNNQTTGGTSSGVRGVSLSTGAGSAGLSGEEFAATGVVYGVEGTINSVTSAAAGVHGVDAAGAGATFVGFSDGVRGEGKNGIEGFSNTPSGRGIRGIFYNPSQTLVAAGVLGLSTSATSHFGVFAEVGDIGCNSCAKSFVDPHPTDASKVIRYVSLEGGEAGTYFRGTARTVGGVAVIDVPEDFRMVTDGEGLTVQLTPVGAASNMYIASEDLNQIVVRSSSDVKFHYLVHGVRPAFKTFQPIQDGTNFVPQTPEQKMPEGYPEWTKQRLVENGTFTSDGKVNMETAKAKGWDKTWAEGLKNTARADRDKDSQKQK